MKINTLPKQILFYFITTILALLPLVYLTFKILNHTGGEFFKPILHFLGDWSMYFLVLAIFFGFFSAIKKQLIYRQILRLFGLWSLIYAILHIFIYLVSEVDITKPLNVLLELRRAYLFYGLVAFLLILFLVVLSFTKKFNKVASLAYIAGILGAVHYMLSTKLPENLSYAFFILIGVLLGIRLLYSKKSFKKGKQ
ncbi:MAG: hypothetical protein E7K04_00290 [Helicobacter sp.]|nr:hypothetical protein [Helicobacter sp.]